jgi:UDP-galactopyranose mutase
VISYEYPKDYNGHNEPYYPIRDSENIKTYEKYHELTKGLKTHIFGGRLATYVYYDMHQIISQALTMVKEYDFKNVRSFFAGRLCNFKVYLR